MEKKRTIFTAVVFFLLLFALALGQFLPDQALSRAERRKLAQKPALSGAALLSGKWEEGLEDYFLDQFPLRERFRTLQSVLRFYVLRQGDSDGVYLTEGQAVKMEYPLKENQIVYAAEKLEAVRQQYLAGSEVYYSVVPDKNYFTAGETGHLAVDYDRFPAILGETVENAAYVDLFGVLTLDDYYRTDAHWKQESIHGAAEKLGEAMGVTLAPYESYTPHALSPFYGVYYGQAALPLPPDTLTYLTSPFTESAAVTGLEFEGERPVYTPESIAGMDGYDVFLSGAQSVLTVTCQEAASERELVIFRDSYGSSIAPYFLGAYKTVTLIDLRYIPAAMLADYVDFHGQDVLFLYSTTLLNSGMLLK